MKRRNNPFFYFLYLKEFTVFATNCVSNAFRSQMTFM